MANIVLAHGAWSAAWAWKKMRPLFAAAGHQFFSPTYTGLGERSHLANPAIDLSTHIRPSIIDLTPGAFSSIAFYSVQAQIASAGQMI